MTIGDDIGRWATTRPLWQQEILQVLADGSPVTETELARAIDSLLDPQSAGAAKPLNLSLASADDVTVTLAALRGCKGVNALTEDQELDFGASGLTVIYGDNGSGKSGYARLIKEAVGARHPAEILPDVFQDRGSDPCALMQYTADHDPREHKVPGPADPLIRQMHFYDEHCGDAYLARKSIITYRPSALVLLDGLINVCDRLRNAVADRLRDNHQRALELDLPPGTVAAAFAASVTAETSEADLDSATTLDPEATEKMAAAMGEVARLEASSASAERARLTALAQAAAALSALLAAAGEQLGIGSLERANEKLQRAQALRDAAVVAAQADFNDELPGVGSATWRALWQAARTYSTMEAYRGEVFPVTYDSARCPLCQQGLSPDARSRLDRFDRYMRDTTERDASAAEDEVQVQLQRWRELSVGAGTGAAHLVTVREAAPELAKQVQAQLELAGTGREAAVAWLEGLGARPQALNVPSDELDVATTKWNAAAAAVDVEAFKTSLESARSRAGELSAHMRLCESRAALQLEVARLKERRLLEAAQGQVVTTTITAKSTQLTKQYAGDVIKDAFIRETERLRLRRVTIRDLGGNKGQLEQQPGLLGAKAARIQAAQVLSEGEQTALGLAGFFTEAAFDSSRSSLILDDPVTSLDHVRRKYVAARLTELAKDRQVIVFTHDVTFAGELQKQAGKHDVSVTPRSIERKAEVPGFVRRALPWKAKDFGDRLNQVEQQLAGLTRERAAYGQDDGDKAVGSWAGDLSELWESCVNTEILDEVFDRGTAEVRVMKFRILAAVTQEDDKDFQAGYGACSTWARRHNKAQEINYVPPEPDEMEAEVDRIRVWQRRVKKYRN